MLHLWSYIQPYNDLQENWIPQIHAALPTCRCLCYLVANWTGVILSDDTEPVILLSSKEYVSVWTDKNLKYIDFWEPHQMWILSQILDHVMDLRQNTDEAIELGTKVASTIPIPDKTKEDNPWAYKSNYIIHIVNSNGLISDLKRCSSLHCMVS